MRNGFITLDFLFSFVLVMGFSVILFSLSLTLTVAEVTQYITFAAARAYSAAHISQIHQQKAGEEKFKELMAKPAFRAFFTSGWFQVQTPPLIGDIAAIKTDYQESPNNFWGVGTDFTAHMLDFEIPLYGSTTDDGDGKGFKTFIGSYLGREITIRECINFTTDRWKAIRRLNVVGGAPYTNNTVDDGYVSIVDDGC